MTFALWMLWVSTLLQAAETESLSNVCMEQMRALPGAYVEADVKSACSRVIQMEGCKSENGVPIYHYERAGTSKNPKRIFVKSLIHGDEVMSGVVGRSWMARLEKIDPRNTWRIIPVVNPDGWKAKSRTNARGVDLNRNFPTAKWDDEAITYWKKKMKSDPRRYPGPKANSEPETECLMKHFADFKPDFLISVHTPLGVLDLDGPRLPAPKFQPLPWMSLGNFPGSLGRYMWVDQKIPVLTIELKGSEDVKRLEAFDQLQDISGTVAIQAHSATSRNVNSR